jgi:hypothetical protein
VPVSKSVRFEVFARDQFTCQYCGRRPPEIVLELDHIHPRSKGGDDELTNLLTSCWDCNRGKAAKVISEVASRPDADLMYLRVEQEIAEAKRFLEAKSNRDQLLDRVRDALEETWAQYITPELPDVVIWDTWIRKYGPDEVELAINMCARKAQYSDLTRGAPSTVVNKCGRYVSGILKKRLEDANG